MVQITKALLVFFSSILVFLDLRQFIRLTCNEIKHSERECRRGTWHDINLLVLHVIVKSVNKPRSAYFIEQYKHLKTTFQFPFTIHISKCIPQIFFATLQRHLLNVRSLFPPQGGTICLCRTTRRFFFLLLPPSSKCGAFLKPSSLWINPGEWTFRALIILGHLASFSPFHLFKRVQTLPVPSYHCFRLIAFD